METLLISKAKVASLLQVAIGTSEQDFNVYIREAQQFDLKNLLCDDFYFDLLKNYETEPYKKILDGGPYEVGERTYDFLGLGAVLAWYAYARYFLNHPYVTTTHGVVVKKNEFSEPVSREDRLLVYNKKRKEANDIFIDVQKFVERTPDVYTSWDCRSNCQTPSGRNDSGFNTTVLK